MIVAFGAAHRGSQPDGTKCAHAVCAILGQVLVRLQAALRGSAIQAVVRRGYSLFRGGAGQQVSGQLLASELVEGLIVAEGAQHVIAIGPGRPDVVAVKAGGIREAHRVKPMHGAHFSVGGRAKQAID